MARAGESRTESQVLALKRQREALAYREAGLSYAEIATELGYANEGGAYKAVQRGLQRALQEPAAHVRALSLSRLDRMLRAIWRAVIGGDLFAIDRALKIEERRAKLLGLDKADMVDIEERIRLIARALGQDEDAAVAEAQRVIREHAYGRAL